jgi:hypothetical protein
MNKDNLYIGVDFSYNSCGITYMKGDGIHHQTIFNTRQICKDVDPDDELVYSKSEVLQAIKGTCDIIMHYRDSVPQAKDIGLQAWERIHMIQTIMYKNVVLKSIFYCVSKRYPKIPQDNVFIAFENYITGKATSNIIQTIEMTCPVKQHIIENMLNMSRIENFYVVPAPTVKAFAGRGDFDKYDMFQAYLKEPIENGFHKTVSDKRHGEIWWTPRIKKGKPFNEMIAPVPDIVDSYFVAKWLKKQME